MNRGLNYDDATNVAMYWRNKGLNDSEIIRRAGQAGDLLISDSQSVIVNRALQALTSLSLVWPYCLIGRDVIVEPKLFAEQMCAH